MPEEEKLTEEDRTAARDFTLARLAIARGYAGAICTGLDHIILTFAHGEHDPKGADRIAALDEMSEMSGLLSRALEAAQDLIEDVDFTEGEPDIPEGDGYDEEGAGDE